MDSSDINLAVMPCTDETVTVDALMSRIRQELEEVEGVRKAEYLREMRMIRAEATEEYQGKILNFTIVDSGYNGDACVELTKGYVERFPEIRVLLYVIKNILYLNHLSDQFNGGLCTYALTIMLYAYIQL